MGEQSQINGRCRKSLLPETEGGPSANLARRKACAGSIDEAHDDDAITKLKVANAKIMENNIANSFPEARHLLRIYHENRSLKLPPTNLGILEPVCPLQAICDAGRCRTGKVRFPL
jgi:hypothetical protein